MTLADSPNFTAADTQGAIDATEDEVTRRLVAERCKCGQSHPRRTYALKRLAPHHYWVVQLGCDVCRESHQLIFRLTDPSWRV